MESFLFFHFNIKLKKNRITDYQDRSVLGKHLVQPLDEGSEAQRGAGLSSRSHSKSQCECGAWALASASQPWAPNLLYAFLGSSCQRRVGRIPFGLYSTVLQFLLSNKVGLFNKFSVKVGQGFYFCAWAISILKWEHFFFFFNWENIQCRQRNALLLPIS